MNGEKTFLYRGKTHSGTEVLVGFTKNSETKEKQYFVMNEIPSDENNISQARARLETFNKGKEENFQAGIVTRRRTKVLTGKREKKAFILMPCEESAANEQIKQLKEQKVKQIAVKVGAPALAVLVTFSAMSFGLKDRGAEPQTPTNATEPTSSYVESWPQESMPNIEILPTNPAETSPTEPTETTPQNPNEYEEFDFSNLTYRTYTNSAGTIMIELGDALKIADACFEEVKRQVEEYNKSVSKNKQFPIEFLDECGAGMFVAACIRESSLVDLSVYMPDINDPYIGSFKIGDAAHEEINEISIKLTGKKIFNSRKDRYKFGRALIGCIYMYFQNHKYCASVVGAENVTPEMVADAYLRGCGEVIKYLRENYLDKNGKYNGKEYVPMTNYAKDIMYYTVGTKAYLEEIKSGTSDGSHADSHKWYTSYLWGDKSEFYENYPELGE